MSLGFKTGHGALFGLAVAAVVAAAAYVMQAGPGAGRSTTPATPAMRAGAGHPLQEVDFGFADLDPGGQAVPIPSYKNGGSMVLRPGDELHYQAMGDGPIPTLELRVGDAVELLTAPSGTVVVAVPADRALVATLRAQGSRLSLPGNSPPRISVKAQVFGVARPPK